MLKLAERMVLSFCTGVGASTAHTWTTLSGSGADDVRVMTRKSIDDPGRPPGIVLSAATSFWIPVPPKRVFDFLRDENSRSEVRNIYFICNYRLRNRHKFYEQIPYCVTNYTACIDRSLVNSGLAFGAKRWVTTLDRQCERLASAMANNIPAGDVGGTYDHSIFNFFPLQSILQFICVCR